MELCYIDGQFVPPEEAKLPVSDLIIQRGVGVFEAFGTIQGRPLMMTQHIERLMKSAEGTNIHTGLSMDEMKIIVREGIARVKAKTQSEVSIRVFLTGGDVFDSQNGFSNPRFLVIFDKLTLPPKSAYENGVALNPLPYGRDDPSVKSVNYRATYAPGLNAFEVLYCPNGEITEAGHSTFFMVLGGALLTAPLSRVLAGTTRAAILKLAREAKDPKIFVAERCPLVSELEFATEAFITGSTKQVVPVVQVGDIIIGDGKPGSVTKRLSDLYKKHIQAWLE